MVDIRHLAIVAAALSVFGAHVAAAQHVWHAVRTLMPGDVVRNDDVVAQPASRRVRDAMPATSPIVGLEVKRRIYQGYDISEHDVGAVTIVKASTMVTLLWKSGGLTLQLSGRALDAGAMGDEVRVLNPDTLRTIRGTVVGEGTVEVRTIN